MTRQNCKTKGIFLADAFGDVATVSRPWVIQQHDPAHFRKNEWHNLLGARFTSRTDAEAMDLREMERQARHDLGRNIIFRIRRVPQVSG
jgi:hypothetical protein